MSQPSPRVSASLSAGIAALLAASPALAAEVRGVVSLPPPPPIDVLLGYTRIRVTGASTTLRANRSEAAIFMKVSNALPLPPPTTKWPFKVSGLRFEPQVVACAVDEQIEITNTDATPVTVVIGSDTLKTIPPGGTANYACQQGGPHSARIQEWPHVRGLVYVGEVGVAAMPKEDGKFALAAPAGTYELTVIGPEGAITAMPVTVAKVDVDLGTISRASGEPPKAAPSPSAPAGGGTPAPAAAPAAAAPSPPPASPPAAKAPAQPLQKFVPPPAPPPAPKAEQKAPAADGEKKAAPAGEGTKEESDPSFEMEP